MKHNKGPFFPFHIFFCCCFCQSGHLDATEVLAVLVFHSYRASHFCSESGLSSFLTVLFQSSSARNEESRENDHLRVPILGNWKFGSQIWKFPIVPETMGIL